MSPSLISLVGVGTAIKSTIDYLRYWKEDGALRRAEVRKLEAQALSAELGNLRESLLLLKQRTANVIGHRIPTSSISEHVLSGSTPHSGLPVELAEDFLEFLERRGVVVEREKVNFEDLARDLTILHWYFIRTGIATLSFPPDTASGDKGRAE